MKTTLLLLVLLALAGCGGGGSPTDPPGPPVDYSGRYSGAFSGELVGTVSVNIVTGADPKFGRAYLSGIITDDGAFTGTGLVDYVAGTITGTLEPALGNFTARIRLSADRRQLIGTAKFYGDKDIAFMLDRE